MAVTPLAQAPILVVGGTGQVGFELVRALAPLGDVVAPARSEIDLMDGAGVARYVATLKPRVIVNAAAYTAVDRAEQEPAAAEALNAAGPEALAFAAGAVGAVFVHYSTDYVFDGAAPAAYREDDAPAPLNVYGATKLRGEERALAATDAVLIFRSSWVYGARGSNFLRTVRRLAAERGELRIVDDQVGSPTWSRMIASATAAVLARLGANPREMHGAAVARRGVYHMTGPGDTSWAGFAEAIVQRDAAAAGHAPVPVIRIPTTEYPTAARRPLNSRLDSGRLASSFGVALPHWRRQLELLLAEGA